LNDTSAGKLVLPGHFEPANHFYPRALNATIHPMVAFFLRLSRENQEMALLSSKKKVSMIMLPMPSILLRILMRMLLTMGTRNLFE